MKCIMKHFTILKRRTSWQFICYSPRSAASSRSYGKDTAKLQNLYEQGYEDAKRQFADLKAFLQNSIRSEKSFSAFYIATYTLLLKMYECLSV